MEKELHKETNKPALKFNSFPLASSEVNNYKPSKTT